MRLLVSVACHHAIPHVPEHEVHACLSALLPMIKCSYIDLTSLASFTMNASPTLTRHHPLAQSIGTDRGSFSMGIITADCMPGYILGARCTAPAVLLSIAWVDALLVRYLHPWAPDDLPATTCAVLDRLS